MAVVDHDVVGERREPCLLTGLVEQRPVVPKRRPCCGVERDSRRRVWLGPAGEVSLCLREVLGVEGDAALDEPVSVGLTEVQQVEEDAGVCSWRVGLKNAEATQRDVVAGNSQHRGLGDEIDGAPDDLAVLPPKCGGAMHRAREDPLSLVGDDVFGQCCEPRRFVRFCEERMVSGDRDTGRQVRRHLASVSGSRPRAGWRGGQRAELVEVCECVVELINPVRRLRCDLSSAPGDDGDEVGDMGLIARTCEQGNQCAVGDPQCLPCCLVDTQSSTRGDERDQLVAREHREVRGKAARVERELWSQQPLQRLDVLVEGGRTVCPNRCRVEADGRCRVGGASVVVSVGR